MITNWSINKKYLILGLIILLLDRITKLAALRYCIEECIVTPFLSLYLTFNRGISWGMFHDSCDAVFILITLLIVLFVGVITAVSIKRGSFGLAETMVVAGALGNIIDRLYYQQVIDFILIWHGSWSFPVFNIADAAIVVGAIAMLMKGWYE